MVEQVEVIADVNWYSSHDIGSVLTDSDAELSCCHYLHIVCDTLYM